MKKVECKTSFYRSNKTLKTSYSK